MGCFTKQITVTIQGDSNQSSITRFPPLCSWGVGLIHRQEWFFLSGIQPMLKIKTNPGFYAILAGAHLPLAFAPVGLFPFGFLVPLVLLVLWEGVTPRRAAQIGFLFGCGFFGIGVSWVFISIHDMGHLSLWLAGLITILLIAFLALFPALQGYLTARFFPGKRVAHAILIFPCLWLVAEALRGWVLTGCPWLYLGYSQMESPLSGLAPVVGVLGVSLATTLTSGLLWVLWRGQVWSVRIGAGLALVVLWGTAALLQGVEWTAQSGEPFRVSLVQVATPQQVRWRIEERQANIRRYVELTKQHWDAQLIVWPENALTVFYHEATDFLEALTTEAQKHKADLLIGLPFLDPATLQYYNALVALPSKKFYFKHHLVPFTEFLPFKEQIHPLINFFQIPMSDFSPGAANQEPLLMAGHRIGLSICYDAAFPEEIAAALPAAELLINVSNDGWFGNSLAPHQNLQMAQMRALETGRWLLRSTNTGISAFIGPNGQVLAETPLFQDAVLTHDVQPMTGTTPYARRGNTPVWVLVVLCLVVGGWLTRRREDRWHPNEG